MSVPATRLVLVTGMSGAGRSTALKALEDLGFEVVDNLPVTLLKRLVQGGEKAQRPLAVGVDIRSRDFAVEALLQETDRLATETEISVSTLFLDCDDDILIRRYTETRRRHPLAADRPVVDGVRLERLLMRPLRDRADVLVDTSAITIWDLKQRIAEVFRGDQAPGLSIMVTSFSYRFGVPRDAGLVLDVRFLNNPHYDPALSPLTGRDAAVGAYIQQDPDCARFLDRLEGLLDVTLPRYEREGKSYLTIAVGCTGGRHRSVFVAERLASWLGRTDWPVYLHHRELARDQDDNDLKAEEEKVRESE